MDSAPRAFRKSTKAQCWYLCVFIAGAVRSRSRSTEPIPSTPKLRSSTLSLSDSWNMCTIGMANLLPKVFMLTADEGHRSLYRPSTRLAWP